MADIMLPIAGVAFFVMMLGLVAGLARLGRLDDSSAGPRLTVVETESRTAPGEQKRADVRQHVARAGPGAGELMGGAR